MKTSRRHAVVNAALGEADPCTISSGETTVVGLKQLRYQPKKQESKDTVKANENRVGSFETRVWIQNPFAEHFVLFAVFLLFGTRTKD